MPQEERRRYKRTIVDIPVRIFAPGKKESIKGMAKDISIGGAYIQCGYPFSTGDKLLLEIQYEGLGLLHAQVTISSGIMAEIPERTAEPSIVRWIRQITDKGFGVEFLNLSPANKNFVTRLLRYLERQRIEQQPQDPDEKKTTEP